jgi:hypothetical protein
MNGEETRRWSRKATGTSAALKLEPDVFTWSDPERIARSLLRSARRSSARKGTPYGSAMSMLCFYINRAGSGLDPDRRAVLEAAKDELRALAGRPPPRGALRDRAGR